MIYKVFGHQDGFEIRYCKDGCKERENGELAVTASAADHAYFICNTLNVALLRGIRADKNRQTCECLEQKVKSSMIPEEEGEEDYRQKLVDIWHMTGIAPAGIPGVPEGMLLSELSHNVPDENES